MKIYVSPIHPTRVLPTDYTQFDSVLKSVLVELGFRIDERKETMRASVVPE